MPGGGRDVDLPGNMEARPWTKPERLRPRRGLPGSPRQTLEVASANQAIPGSGPKANAAPGMTAAPLAAGAGTFFARFGPCGRSCTGFGA